MNPFISVRFALFFVAIVLLTPTLVMVALVLYKQEMRRHNDSVRSAMLASRQRRSLTELGLYCS